MASAHQKFMIHLYGPKKSYLKGVEGEMIFIPTQRGQIQLLKDHTHLITLLGIGSLVIDKQPLRFVLSKGVCKVLDSQIILLAKEVFVKEELKKERIQEEMEKIQQRMKSSLPMQEGEFEELDLTNQKLKAQWELFNP